MPRLHTNSDDLLANVSQASTLTPPTHQHHRHSMSSDPCSLFPPCTTAASRRRKSTRRPSARKMKSRWIASTRLALSLSLSSLSSLSLRSLRSLFSLSLSISLPLSLRVWVCARACVYILEHWVRIVHLSWEVCLPR